MHLKLKVWRQKNAESRGELVDYELPDANTHMSFLEMLDHLNERLIERGEEPIAFDSDCREGICGMCSLMIDGVAHGPDPGTATCQLHMRRFREGETVVVEPWRAKAFPVVKDLVVDRSAFDRVIQRGGFISVKTGGAPDANALPIAREIADRSMDAAACIGCGACVAACKNASASLFVAAKIAHLNELPQGRPERFQRALAMILQADAEGFGACTNTYDCEAVCPKEISVDFIAAMNRDYRRALLRGE